MSQKSFLDNKKSRKNFPYVGRGGVNQHMENSICFVVFFLKASLSYCGHKPLTWHMGLTMDIRGFWLQKHGKEFSPQAIQNSSLKTRSHLLPKFKFFGHSVNNWGSGNGLVHTQDLTLQCLLIIATRMGLEQD